MASMKSYLGWHKNLGCEKPLNILKSPLQIVPGCTLCEIFILFDWLCRSSKPLCSVMLSDGNHNDGETNSINLRH